MPKIRTQPCSTVNICSDCVPPKPFASKTTLAQHVKETHLGVRHKCTHPGCAEEFKQITRMKDHVKHAHEGKVKVTSKLFLCPRADCKSAFETRQGLEKHVDVHDKVRKFPCTVPGCERGPAKPFSQKGHLVRHVNSVHGLERPHKCPMVGCFRTFATADNMRKHVNSSFHKNIRPYKCEICEVPFTQNAHLVSHMVCAHYEIRPFQCTREGCTESFNRRDHLSNHVYSEHSAEGKPGRKKSEEKLVRFFKEHGIDFKREAHIDYKCTEVHDDHFARVDFLMIRNGVVVVVENDERQHDWIETVCDVKRMAEIYETLAVGGNTLPIVFIRYNPHDFHTDGELQHVLERDRRMHLLNVLQNPKHQIYDKKQPLKIMHMFYDTCGGVTQVLKEYGLLLEVCVPWVKTPLLVDHVPTASAEQGNLDLWMSSAASTSTGR